MDCLVTFPRVTDLPACVIAHTCLVTDKSVWLVITEEVDRASEIIKQHASHIGGQSLSDQNALDDDVVGIGLQGVSRDLPAAGSQMVCKIVKGIRGIHILADTPGHGRDTFLFPSAVDHLERTELLQFVCKHLCRVVAGGMDTAVPFTTESPPR